MKKTDCWKISGGCFYPMRDYGQWLQMAGKSHQQLLAELKRDHPNLSAKDWTDTWRKVADNGSLIGEPKPPFVP